MNLPNYLSFARIVVVPLLVVALLTPVSDRFFGFSGYVLAIILFLIASFTDILDGHLARRRNQVSTLGKFRSPTPSCVPLPLSCLWKRTYPRRGRWW